MILKEERLETSFLKSSDCICRPETFLVLVFIFGHLKGEKTGGRSSLEAK